MTHRSRVAPLCLFALCALVAKPAFAGDTDDTVLLKNGGRVRGAVVEEDPVKGVRIKLPDGTVKSIPAADVKQVQYGQAKAVAPPAAEPAAPPAAPPAGPTQAAGVGSIHVETSAPASVSVDGGVVGKAPVDVPNVGMGRHRVHVDFEEGGDEETIVLVTSGTPTIAKFDLPIARQAARFRDGAHLFVEGELLGVPLSTLSGAGIRMATGLNLGLSSAIDVRLAGIVGGIWGSPFPYYDLGARAALRFNLGSIYSMEAGFQGGVTLYSGNGTIYPDGFYGPEVSVATFRFGSRRQFEIGSRQGMRLNGAGAFEVGGSFTYLFLPDATPSSSGPANLEKNDHAQ